ncbi:aspartyl protease family protein [Sphingomonas baiyangensis]|uniref:Aspartyl protease n=1 Tax=Sphingomonas baiyangensis TaxID=2572576 RepID=A0A4U1L204_9SPHN|nr:aspartyl protease family protein [Sphingomonas baiyangensis]TKD49995.1 hypothetical protein FBR43_03905 [Sphingomonas baiyangensis]
MLQRARLSLCLAALIAGAQPGVAQQVAPPPAAATPSPTEEQLLAFRESERRMHVPVRVGDAGPYRFIIDTGAERSAISRQVAGTLGLAAGPTVRVAAMTGSRDVATVRIPSLHIDRLARPQAIDAPSFEREHLGADGLIGLDALANNAVHIDFEAREMRVERASRRRLSSNGDEIVVVGRSLAGRLIVSDAYVRGKRIAVVLDTGTSVSVGNAALFRLIEDRSTELPPVHLVSVTGEAVNAPFRQLHSFEVGDVTFRDVPIAFADAAPFERLGLTDRPAMFLGMDALHLFRQVRIDFPNRQVRFLLPRGPRLALNQRPTRLR